MMRIENIVLNYTYVVMTIQMCVAFVFEMFNTRTQTDLHLFKLIKSFAHSNIGLKFALLSSDKRKRQQATTTRHTQLAQFCNSNWNSSTPKIVTDMLILSTSSYVWWANKRYVLISIDGNSTHVSCKLWANEMQIASNNSFRRLNLIHIWGALDFHKTATDNRKQQPNESDVITVSLCRYAVYSNRNAATTMNTSRFRSLLINFKHMTLLIPGICKPKSINNECSSHICRFFFGCCLFFMFIILRPFECVEFFSHSVGFIVNKSDCRSSNSVNSHLLDRNKITFERNNAHTNLQKFVPTIICWVWNWRWNLVLFTKKKPSDRANN